MPVMSRPSNTMLARRRADLAGQHLEEGAFAGAVRADNAAQFALLDREIDIAVGYHAAIALGQTRRLQNRLPLSPGCGRRGDGVNGDRSVVR